MRVLLILLSSLFSSYNTDAFLLPKTKTNTNSSTFRVKPKVSRPGVHAKTKTSSHKDSKNYKKLSRGQG